MAQEKQLDLGGDYGPVSISINGVIVSVSADGVVHVQDDRPTNDKPVPGQPVRGKGVYLGVWEPQDQEGRTLGKIFDLYAAPENFLQPNGRSLLMTFNDAVDHVAGLKNFHGHDGARVASEKAVLEAVRSNPEALAKWFIPTKEILHGETVGGDKIQPANLYDSRKIGAFKKTLIPFEGSSSKPARFLLSCTEAKTGESYLRKETVWAVHFQEGRFVDEAFKDCRESSVRVVRAELRR